LNCDDHGRLRQEDIPVDGAVSDVERSSQYDQPDSQGTGEPVVQLPSDPLQVVSGLLQVNSLLASRGAVTASGRITEQLDHHPLSVLVLAGTADARGLLGIVVHDEVGVPAMEALVPGGAEVVGGVGKSDAGTGTARP
jgi:hypothetical protein